MSAPPPSRTLTASGDEQHHLTAFSRTCKPATADQVSLRARRGLLQAGEGAEGETEAEAGAEAAAGDEEVVGEEEAEEQEEEGAEGAIGEHHLRHRYPGQLPQVQPGKIEWLKRGISPLDNHELFEGAVIAAHFRTVRGCICPNMHTR